MGTDDWDFDDLHQHIRSLLKGAAIWVPQAKLRSLRSLLADWQAENPNVAINQQQIDRLLRKIPEPSVEPAARAVALLKEQGIVAEEVELKARNLLVGDPTFTSLVKGGARTT